MWLSRRHWYRLGSKPQPRFCQPFTKRSPGPIAPSASSKPTVRHRWITVPGIMFRQRVRPAKRSAEPMHPCQTRRRNVNVRDLRKYASQTNVRLIVGGLLLLFIVGGGLIYLFYGPGAALTGVLCLLIGLVPIVLIMLFLWLLDWIVKRANPD